MAPSRGRGKARANPPSGARASAATGSTRATRKSQIAAGDAYDELLAEASKTECAAELSDRPLKRRRVAAKASPERAAASAPSAPDIPSAKGKQRLQTIEDSSASDDDSDESEFDFEDVDLEQADGPVGQADVGGTDDIADVSVAVDTAKVRPQSRVKRKPVSAAEKASRLLVHKTHVLCLLGHCLFVNSWCNDEAVHKHLRPLLPEKITNFLNPKPKDSQFRQNEAFVDGIQQASDIFRGDFNITASGMRSAQWGRDNNEVATDPMDRADFIRAAKNLTGSQDTGGQLFCAMLRAVGVEARMVCSLQPLPFANPSAQPSTPQKIVKPKVYATIYDKRPATTHAPVHDSATRSSSTIGQVPSARRRLGQPAFAPESSASTASPKPKKSVQRLQYPVFWTEAFNPAHQKWIAVDPLVTQTVSKPSKLEPPASYAHNQLSYAIAFESSAVAKDVTRRYARAFNAKTRRSRVESTEHGTAWLKKVLRVFRRTGGALDRDQVEDAELAQREAREGLPSNVLDFKDHPYYALERHMKRHEVITPKREVGKVNAGTAAKPRMEAVFRRKDVCVCRSADKWYRLGRTVKEGEVAVKRVPARRSRKLRSPSHDDGEAGDEAAMTPLYTVAQTDLYIPPAVSSSGRVPRNAFGNLDIYVPSMVPAGGRHIRHPLARTASLALKVDSVDAVVGFQFKGRQGTAIIDGVIVADVHAEGVMAAIRGLEEDKEEEENRARSAMALRVWRRFVLGLRVRERVRREYGEEAQGDDEEAEEEQDGGEGGGLLEGGGADEHVLPTAGKFFLAELMTPKKGGGVKKARKGRDESEEEAEFEEVGSDEDLGEVTEVQPSASRRSTRRRVVHDEDEDGDEYMPDQQVVAHTEDIGVEDDGGGGGFLPDSEKEDGQEGDDGGGGGFDLDEQGGGFLPDDDAGDELGGGGGVVPDPDVGVEEMMGDGGGGFMPDDDDEEMAMDSVGPRNTSPPAEEPAMLTHDAPVTSMASPTAAPHPVEVVDDDIVDHGMSSEIDATLRETGAVQIDKVAKAPSGDVEVEMEEDRDEKEDESDRGSMLSHDPEDEDAEPDWLESD